MNFIEKKVAPPSEQPLSREQVEQWLVVVCAEHIKNILARIAETQKEYEEYQSGMLHRAEAYPRGILISRRSPPYNHFFSFLHQPLVIPAAERRNVSAELLANAEMFETPDGDVLLRDLPENVVAKALTALDSDTHITLKKGDSFGHESYWITPTSAEANASDEKANGEAGKGTALAA